MSKHYVIMRVGNTYAKVPVQVRNGSGTIPVPPVDPSPDQYVSYNVFDSAIGDINNSISLVLNQYNQLDTSISEQNAQILQLLNMVESITGGVNPIDEAVLGEIEKKLRVLDVQPGGLQLEKDEHGNFFVSFFGESSSHLENYILERYNEMTNQWEAYDNGSGIVN